MITSSRIEIFLSKYLDEKNISWLELFFYEFYKYNSSSHQKEVKLILRDNAKFFALATQISYHLLECLYSTINDLAASNQNVLNLRNFLTSNAGGKFVYLLSDLHICNVTNERELVNVLTKVFPNDYWESEEVLSVSRLAALSRDEVKEMFSKQFRLTRPDLNGSCTNTHDISIDETIDMSLEECLNDDDFKAFNSSFYISSAELAERIIRIFYKLLDAEREKTSVDRSYLTVKCLNFCIDTLSRLNEKCIFNNKDQTVIKIKIAQLTCQCFNSLAQQDDNVMKVHLKRICSILETGAIEMEITYGLIMCIITTIGSLCLRDSSQRNENLKMLKLCDHLVLKQMEILSNSEFLLMIQKRLVEIIAVLKKIQKPQNVARKRKIRKNDIANNHHHSQMDACVFERILIESVALVKGYKQLAFMMNILKAKGICCCNGNIKTISLFMQSTTIAPQFLRFIEEKIVRVMFQRNKICIYCNKKLDSIEFCSSFFTLLKNELKRREGYELFALLNHLNNIQKCMSRTFLMDFIDAVIVPSFDENKILFFNDIENNTEAKLIAANTLQIISEHSNEKDILNKFLTSHRIDHLRDLTLIPSMSVNACVVLGNGIKLLDDQRLVNQIKTIFYANSLYLTHELIALYEEADLPKEIVFNELESHENVDFVILDQQAVIVKENLSNLDILLLNMNHWNIFSDLMNNSSTFQKEFMANIYNNFHKNILFVIACNALKILLLKKEENFIKISSQTKRTDTLAEVDLSKQILDYEARVNQPISIICETYDLNYEQQMRDLYCMFENSQKFSDKLRDEEEFLCVIYRPRRDKTLFINLTTHRDNFLPEALYDGYRHESYQHQQQHWIDSFRVGAAIFDSTKSIRDAFLRVLNRFLRPDDDLKAIHCAQLIKEITGKFGIKYLSVIARNCFDISFQLTSTSSLQSFNSKMSSALDELKLLLLQTDDWNDSENNKKAIVDALQFLLGVAEMKTRGVNRMLILNSENHTDCATESIFSELNASSSEGGLSINSNDDSDDDRNYVGEKKTDSFITADENYDADEEYFSMRGDDTMCSQSFKTTSSVTLYDVRSTSDHICQMVVEILMDISKRCIQSEENVDVLIPLAQRLSCMKNFLGGSEFLLNGFSPILTSNLNFYKTFQNAILDLIEEINTPKILKTFFSILTEENAPVELIIARMVTLCNKEINPKPFCAVKYPTNSTEDTVSSSCDPYLHGVIQNLKNVNRSRSPFVEASQIIPLNFLELKLWSSSIGYTLSTWIEIHKNTEISSTIHLFSIGTEKLILAIFLNSDGIFEFVAMKPSYNQNRSKLRVTKSLDSYPQRPNTSSSSDKENVNKTNILGLGSVVMRDREVSASIRTRASLRNAFRKSLKNDENSRQMETSRVIVKSKKSKLKCHKWTHVCLAFRNSDAQISILLTLNGTEHENIEIPIDGMNGGDDKSDMNGEFQLLFIGANSSEQKENVSHMSYSMSNITFFKSCLDAFIVAYLYALGPNCNNFNDCEILQILPLRGSLDLTKMINRISLKMTSHELMKMLRTNVLLTYAIGQSNYAIGFLKSGDYGKPLEIFTNGYSPTTHPIKSIARAVYFSGGLSSLLFLFARTVELTNDPITQSSALFIFLKMAYSNNYLYAEFEHKKLFNLVAHVFKHGNCYRGPGMLKAILDVIFGGTMFNKKSKADEYQINERSELNIQNPSLLMKLLTNFNIFQTYDRTNAINLDLLFKSLKVATRDSHPFKSINRQCLIEHGFYERIIDFCKIHLTSNCNSVMLTSSTAIVLVDLLKMLSKNPPIYIVNKIQELLILLHHPSESFITHDRSKFNFNLSSQKPMKTNRNSAISSKFYFNFSTKIRSTNTSSLPASPSSSQRSSVSNSPKSPKLLTTEEMKVFFNEADNISKSFKGSTDSSSTASKPKVKSQKYVELDNENLDKLVRAYIEMKNSKTVKTPTKVLRKRLGSTPKSPFEKKKKPLRKVSVKNQNEEEIDAKLIENFDALMARSSFHVTESSFNRYEAGICVLQEYLFLMMRDALLSIDDNRVQMDIADCIKIESLIMFANHHDANVRSVIIKLANTIITRQSQEMVNFYQKSHYWVHFGNQLAISPVNLRVIQACANWILMSEKSAKIEEINKREKLEIKFKDALRILIELITSTTHNAKVLKTTMQFFKLVMESNADSIHTLANYGFVVATLKALMKVDDDDMLETIHTSLEDIATKSFLASNAIHILWELLYGLVYAERGGISKNSIRDIHLSILRHLLSLCLVEQNRRASRNSDSFQPGLMVTKVLANLPSSEIKTRFNLIHDRAVQFVMSWDRQDDLKTFEVDFVKYLIDLYFLGIHQGSSLLLWALNPNCLDEIRHHVAQKIITTLAIDASFSVSEPKILKAFLHQLIVNSSYSYSEDQLRVISKYCGVSLNQQQQNYDLIMASSEKIKTIHQNVQREHLQQIEKILFKNEPLSQTIIDGAMRMTREVIDIQNRERRQLMTQLKKTQEIDFYHEWHELIHRMTHEGGPWYNVELYPNTFELDETEGPARMRIRMKRTSLKIEERFFMEGFKHKADYQHKKPLLDFLLHPKETERYSINEQIIFTFNGKHLTLENEIEGEIIVTDNQLNFLANTDSYTNSIICNITDIREVCDRRYQHKEIALEIFLKCSKNFFLIFETKYERDIVTKFLGDKTEKKEGSEKVEKITQRWIENKLTNYEYLIELNKISGRSYNDLMQYPVFPWILTDYTSDVLDLTTAESFRKLEKTISTQNEEKEKEYVIDFNYLMQQMNDMQTILKPYHYSSHYSNSGTVLHFLVRMPPFTNMFLLYQDHNFDIPDRTFHSLATSYRLTSLESKTDVKELTPEFFYLPDFLINNEGFNYGMRQSGELVNDVILPPWSEKSARIFTFIHRQALESEFVRKQLHQWIDLIFGFKQKGKAAIEAVNVFHPATYPEFQISNITDHVERSAYETMICTYGQMPKQIFSSPHKKSSQLSEKFSQELHFALRGVKGLKWGIFTGSPQLPKPRKLSAKMPIPCKQRDARLVPVYRHNLFFVVPHKSYLMKGSVKKSYDIVLWQENDGVVRTKSLSESKSRKIFNTPTCDPITACGADVNYSNLWFGHRSGNISVYVRIDKRKQATKRGERSQKVLTGALEAIIDIRVNEKSLSALDEETEVITTHWNFPITLLRHSASITSIKICTEFKIVVSIAQDGRTVIWDSQKIEFIRSILPPCNSLSTCLTHVDVSPTLGDILTVFRPKSDYNDSDDDDSLEMTDNCGDDFVNISMSIAGKSQLRLHNINAKYIGHLFLDGIVMATCFSFIKEGTGINVFAVALNDSSIRLYSTWNLSFVREIATGCNRISEISFSSSHYLIILSDQEIHIWGSDGIPSERPSFHDIIFE